MKNTMKLSTSHREYSVTDPWPEGAIPRSWIESLFDKMAFSYGVRFADQWVGISSEGMLRHWAEKLGALSRDELLAGFRMLETRTWPPTLPEFIALCRPQVDPVVAFHEALEQGGRRERGDPDEWSSPAVFWAWRKIGAYDFKHLAYAALKTRWEAALAAELAKEEHEPIPVRMVALPAPGKTALSAEGAQRMVSECKELRALGGAQDAGDERRWARKILARKSAGESMAIALLESAEQALGIR